MDDYEEKSIHVVKFSGKTKDCKGCYDKFLAKGRHKGYCTLLIGSVQKEGVSRILTNKDYDWAAADTSAHYKNMKELYHINEVALEDLILSVDHKSKTGKIMF